MKGDAGDGERDYSKMSYKELKALKKERKETLKANEDKLREAETRKWMRNTSKDQYLDFDEDYRRKIKKYFDSLDEDGSQAIGTEELEEPLLTLGIAKSKIQVKWLIDMIDDDKSGQIEFDEFLGILKGATKIHGHNVIGESNESIMKFFKQMVDGNIEGSSPHLAFKMILGQIRRRRLLNLMNEYQNDDVQHAPVDDITLPYSKIVKGMKPDANFDWKKDPHFKLAN